MPKQVEKVVKALKKEGMSDKKAYAIAYSQQNKKTNKKK